MEKLQHPDAHIMDLDENIQDKYQTSLATQKSNKADVSTLKKKTYISSIES